MDKYKKVTDGWFTYYVNTETGEKRFALNDESEKEGEQKEDDQ